MKCWAQCPNRGSHLSYLDIHFMKEILSKEVWFISGWKLVVDWFSNIFPDLRTRYPEPSSPHKLNNEQVTPRTLPLWRKLRPTWAPQRDPWTPWTTPQWGRGPPPRWRWWSHSPPRSRRACPQGWQTWAWGRPWLPVGLKACSPSPSNVVNTVEDHLNLTNFGPSSPSVGAVAWSPVGVKDFFRYKNVLLEEIFSLVQDNIHHPSWEILFIFLCSSSPSTNHNH